MRRAGMILGAALSSLLGACSPNAPGADDLTGYLVTITPSASCTADYGGPFASVVKRRGDRDGWWVFSRPSPLPRDPHTFEVRLRAREPSSVEGDMLGGASLVGVPSRSFWFGPLAPLRPPTTRLPFAGSGSIGAEITATLSGEFRGTTGVTQFDFPVCTAPDHHLHFRPVFDELE